MAIATKDYTEKIDRGITANKDGTRFLFSFTYNGKRKRKVVSFEKQSGWNKRECIKEARKAFIDFEESVASDGLFNGDTKLDVVMEAYFEHEASGSATYNASRKRGYEVYVAPRLGKTPVGKVSLNALNEIKTAMLKRGATRQTKDGCKPKTINEVIVNTLIPILKYAMDNGAIDKIPPFKKLKNDTRKKSVSNATESLAKLYSAIMERYQDDAYYRSMFLFALYGRRFNEIATLHTDDIDIVTMSYTVRAKNSKINEDKTFALPQPLKEALIDLAPDKGLVFHKVGTAKDAKIWTPRKQVVKLAEDTGIAQLTMHYFRHIISSALLELGETSAVAAATLGHNDTATTEKYYATLNNEKSSERAISAISEVLDSN